MKELSSFDVIVLGSGPAGYVAAIRASQAGLSVAMVEKRSGKHLGGTCLNVGCIPTKSLLESAKTWHKLQHLQKQGFHAEKLSYDWKTILGQKEAIVKAQRKGLNFLMKKNNITVFCGHGSCQKSPEPNTHQVLVSDAKTTHILQARSVILATGSQVGMLPHIEVDDKHIFTSDSILDIPAVPKSLCIIGGGVIGMEFASLFGMMGSQVTVVEAADHILATFDRECVKELVRFWKIFDITIHTQTLAHTVKKLSTGDHERGHELGHELKVTLESQSQKYKQQKYKQQKIQYKEDIYCQNILVAVGRKPVSTGIGLEDVGVVTDAAGFVKVDAHYRSSVEGIYAVGDLISTSSLAHTASAEAMHVVEVILAKNPQPICYAHNPLCIYTYPEIAAVGALEEDLKAQNRPYKATQFPFSVMAKAKIEHAASGFMKLLSCPETLELLGVHIVGARATEMISECVLGMSLEATLEELAAVIRPHPTISESISEVAHGALSEPLHL
ncbi:MAG: dihydrolipoyl dehydrogenase [Proteobacteria bacterium]|nr:dihydrolipoyl dehydrogenase [Pseudomonadota bacterium]